MKKQNKKLTLNKTTVSRLNNTDNRYIHGGFTARNCPASMDICESDNCPTITCPPTAGFCPATSDCPQSIPVGGGVYLC